MRGQVISPCFKPAVNVNDGTARVCSGCVGIASACTFDGKFQIH